jgi:GntR family transcriptional repressor for pyruvate dehydrogenase complex
VHSQTAPPLTLAPVARHKLGEQVAQRLLEQIRVNRLAPGTRMPSERRLMEAFGVGRSTVREALNGLAMLGAIEIRQGQGAFVLDDAAAQPPDALARALAKGVTRDLLEARSGVEVQIAELAAERRTPADLRELAGVLDEHAAALATGGSPAAASARFHVALAEAAHNEVLAGFVHSVHELLVERGPALEAQEGYTAWELEQHRGLYEAVRHGQRGLAGSRMREHLDAMIRLHADVGLT